MGMRDPMALGLWACKIHYNAADVGFGNRFAGFRRVSEGEGEYQQDAEEQRKQHQVLSQEFTKNLILQAPGQIIFES